MLAKCKRRKENASTHVLSFFWLVERWVRNVLTNCGIFMVGEGEGSEGDVGDDGETPHGVDEVRSKEDGEKTFY